MTLPQDIERLALLGWRMFPAGTSSSRAACIKGFVDAATHDLDQLAQWAGEYPGCGWGLIPGGSGVWALDLDVAGPDHEHDGVAAFTDLVRVNGSLPAGPSARSGGGGWAVFFADSGAPISGKSGTPAPGIDPRRGRTPLIVPPSRHHRTRKPYTWAVAPWDVPPPVAPDWLLKAVAPPSLPAAEPRPFTLGANPDKARRYAAAALRNATGRVASAGDGGRNNLLNSETFGLGRFVSEGSLSEIEVAQAMAGAALQAGLVPREAAATIASALRARRVA